MSCDMSAFLPEDLEDDWVPARFDSVEAGLFRFAVETESHVRKFDTRAAAMNLVDLIAPGFDYSDARNAVRTREGDVLLLPVSTRVALHRDASQCILMAAGHNLFWGPLFKALAAPAEDWVKVECVYAKGTHAILSTPTGAISAYHHDAGGLREAVAYNARWKIVRCEASSHPERMVWIARTPVSACRS